jgi:hypothetical protein
MVIHKFTMMLPNFTIMLLANSVQVVHNLYVVLADLVLRVGNSGVVLADLVLMVFNLGMVAGDFITKWCTTS